MRKNYLIDYENIKCFKELIEKSDINRYYLFYTNNCISINLDVLSLFESNIKPIKTITGKQSLDMCLSSYVGYLITSNPDEEYYIVSNDCDYDAVINFWRDRGIQISRITRTPKTVKHNALMIQTLRSFAVPTNTTGEIASIVANLYLQTRGKQKIYLELIKKYGKATGGKYYNYIKKLI